MALLVTLLNIKWQNAMGESWENGISMYIHKSGSSEILKNLRPITILNSIYKVCASIVTYKLTPFMNLLTNEARRAYKKTNLLLVPYILHEKRVRKKG